MDTVALRNNVDLHQRATYLKIRHFCFDPCMYRRARTIMEQDKWIQPISSHTPDLAIFGKLSICIQHAW